MEQFGQSAQVNSFDFSLIHGALLNPSLSAWGVVGRGQAGEGRYGSLRPCTCWKVSPIPDTT